MVKIAQRERVDVYTIPPNFAQEGTIFSGRVRLRNAFEAGLLALLLLQALLATDLGVKGKIYAGVIVMIPIVIFAVKSDFFFISVFEISVWSENTYSSGW